MAEFQKQASVSVRERIPKGGMDPDDLAALFKQENTLSQIRLATALIDLRGSLGNGFFETGNADRGGLFGFRVPPGTYVVTLSGEAGNQHVEFFDIVDVTWRTHLRLVEPTCSYETE